MKIIAITILFMIGISCIISISSLVIQTPSGAKSYSQSSIPHSLNENTVILPSTCISLIFNDGLFGTVVNASITFGFHYFDFPFYDIGIGYREEYLQTTNIFGAAEIAGLGYGEMREYAFMYYDDGEFFDGWANKTPVWTSRRLRPQWTESYRDITYNGLTPPDKPPYNESQVLFAGDIIEFENLTIYFQDGSSFLCGPRLITIGANFTQTEEGWITDRIIEVSDDYIVAMTNSSISFTLSSFVPPDFIEIGMIVSVPLVLIIAYYFIRRISKKESEI